MAHSSCFKLSRCLFTLHFVKVETFKLETKINTVNTMIVLHFEMANNTTETPIKTQPNEIWKDKDFESDIHTDNIKENEDGENEVLDEVNIKINMKWSCVIL